MRAVIAAASVPLSIVFVGMGDGPWQFLEHLDDGLTRRHFDNVTFVPLTETLTTAKFPSWAFACEALKQVPAQFQAAKRLGLIQDAEVAFAATPPNSGPLLTARSL